MSNLVHISGHEIVVEDGVCDIVETTNDDSVFYVLNLDLNGNSVNASFYEISRTPYTIVDIACVGNTPSTSVTVIRESGAVILNLAHYQGYTATRIINRALRWTAFFDDGIVFGAGERPVFRSTYLDDIEITCLGYNKRGKFAFTKRAKV
jgi:hypothetical protein